MNKRGIVFSNIKVDVDEKRIMERVAKNATMAQKALDSQVLKDSNHFVPVYTGTLKKSGIMNTVPGSGKVIWHTPYAKAQYYGDDFDHSKQDNPNACSRWFEAAKARFLKKWRKLIDEYI
ncbi:minor capsid protein [Treponema sp.]|uniref:minor capsid protein n=1 Tax=Treponema sp. TaxID=166 RepID=UPI003FD6E26A